MYMFKTNEEYEAEQAKLLEESAQSTDAEPEIVNEDPAYRLINIALDLIDEGALAAAKVLCNKALTMLEEECEGCTSEKDINFLIKDEKEAIKGYEDVMKRTSNPDDNGTLAHIRDDEKEHIEELEGLKKGEHLDKEQEENK